MVADSPYAMDELAMPPRWGAVVGAVAAAAMVPVLAALEPIAGVGPQDAWNALWPGTGGAVFGAVVHLAFGTILGALYAACQQRAPTAALLVVAVFYAVFLWIIGRLLAEAPGAHGLTEIMGTWPWLIACVVYTLALSFAAWWSSARRDPVALPVD